MMPRRAPIVVSLIAFAIALVARPEEAGACSCSMPRVTISPADADAPINSTVIAWLPAYVGKPGEVTFSLRKKVSGDQVPVDYRPGGAAALAVVEMIPRAKLDPNTTYEVVMVKGQGAPQPVGSFATGKTALTGPPAFQGIAKANYYKAVPVCCMCMTDDPYAVLELRDKFPDSKVNQMRFAVWMSDAAGKIDYTKTPTTYHYGSDSLYLGHPSTCSSANFTFPKQKALKLGVKLVDLAGNASAASEVTLDTTKPVKPPER
jgi:hypothetical protein